MKQFFFKPKKENMKEKNKFDLYEGLFSDRKIDSIICNKKFVENMLRVELAISKANYEYGFIPYKAFMNIKKVIKRQQTITYYKTKYIQILNSTIH